MTAPFMIGDHEIGAGKTFVIAEAGVNHNGDPGLAHALIDLAADAGADAVKFQTFRAEALARADAGTVAYQSGATGQASQQDLLRGLELPEAAWRDLVSHCHDRGIAFMSTPFDPASAALVADLGVSAFKIGSGDLTDHILLEAVAAHGRPMILSTGMATLDEVLAAHHFLAGTPHMFLHCTTAYPAPREDLNLAAILSMAEATGVPIGYSDHSPGHEAALIAVGLGASVLEKHITLDQSLPGPDHQASLDPEGLRDYMAAVRRAETMRGNGHKRPMASEQEAARLVRKSLVAARDLPSGHVLRDEDLCAKRPADGMPPTRLPDVVGRRLLRDVSADAAIRPEDLA